MADTTPAASFSVSTSVVPPQNRGFPSDYEHQIALEVNADATEGVSWSPGRKVRITRIRLCSSANALNATNDVALDIDIEDPSASTTKKHDVATYDSTVTADQIAAYAYIDLTLSTTEANLVVENDELLKIVATNATGAGAYITVVVSYVMLDVRDTSAEWPTTP